MRWFFALSLAFVGFLGGCSSRPEPVVAVSQASPMWVLHLQSSPTIYGREALENEAVRWNRQAHGLAPRFAVIATPETGYSLVYGVDAQQAGMPQDESVRQALKEAYPEAAWLVYRR